VIEAELGLVLAMVARSAECWSTGDERNAERWLAGAVEMAGSRGGFVDADRNDKETRP
jgi:hypothetical protein